MLVLYPGGKASASAEGGNAEGMMSIYLRNVAGGDVIAGYTFIIRGAREMRFLRSGIPPKGRQGLFLSPERPAWGETISPSGQK